MPTRASDHRADASREPCVVRTRCSIAAKLPQVCRNRRSHACKNTFDHAYKIASSPFRCCLNRFPLAFSCWRASPQARAPFLFGFPRGPSLRFGKVVHRSLGAGTSAATSSPMESFVFSSALSAVPRGAASMPPSRSSEVSWGSLNGRPSRSRTI